MEWFSWAWARAEAAYSTWLHTPLIRRSGVKVIGAASPRFHWVESYFQAKIHDLMPDKIQKLARQESLLGVRKTVAEYLSLFFQVQGPGTLDEIDQALRKLRSPSPCKDPTAALS